MLQNSFRSFERERERVHSLIAQIYCRWNQIFSCRSSSYLSSRTVKEVNIVAGRPFLYANRKEAVAKLYLIQKDGEREREVPVKKVVCSSNGVTRKDVEPSESVAKENISSN